MPERDPAAKVSPCIVWAPMLQSIAHSDYCLWTDSFLPINTYDATNAAHSNIAIVCSQFEFGFLRLKAFVPQTAVVDLCVITSSIKITEKGCIIRTPCSFCAFP